MTNEIAEVSKERSLAAVVAGDPFNVLERFENDVLILSPRRRPVHRRVVHINSYGGRAVWQKIKCGLVPNHQLLGCLQLVGMGYEVALPEPLPHFNPFRAPFPHDLRLAKWAGKWLGRDGILFSGHTLLYWTLALKRLHLLRSPIVSLVYAREELDWAKEHTGILALTPAAYENAKALAPGVRVAHLGWGVDLDFFRPLPYNPRWFVSCGIANRDFHTLADAARRTDLLFKIVCPGPLNGVLWPPNVEATDGGRGWLTDETKKITAKDLIREYFPGSAATLVVMKADPEERTANGFTNVMEAMALSQPVIVSRAGALPGEIDVQLSGCGIFVPPGDSEALAAAVRAVAADPAMAAAMGAQGRQLVEAHYNIGRCARDLHAFFESL